MGYQVAADGLQNNQTSHRVANAPESDIAPIPALRGANDDHIYADQVQKNEVNGQRNQPVAE